MANDSELIRTNIRLSRDLHARLKRAAIDHDDTVEGFAAKTLEQALTANSPASTEPSDTSFRTPAERRQFLLWASQLRRQADEIERVASDDPSAFLERTAVAFAHAAPVPMVVKQREGGRIVTANPAYLQLLLPEIDPQEALEKARGHTVQAILKLGKKDSSAITNSEGLLSESFEHLHITSRGESRDISVLALRFPLTAYAAGEQKFCIGDLSFESDHLADARGAGHVFQTTAVQQFVDIQHASDFWSSYLRSLNTPALIKEVQSGRIVWANRSFVNLVGEFCEVSGRALPAHPIGKTSAQLFGEDADGRIQRYDMMASQGVAVLGGESLREQERIGARFPISFEGSGIEYIGVLSASEGRFPRKFMSEQSSPSAALSVNAA